MSDHSRLIVKNLPNRINEKRLREFFSTHGTVTDCQLKYDQNGKFRKFAFIGFASDSEAASAKDYYHNTFIDTARIHVELCKKIGENLVRKNANRQKTEQDTLNKKPIKTLVVEIRGFAGGTKKKSLLQFFAPLKPKGIRLYKNDDGTGSALIYLSKHSEVQQLLKKDGKYFGGSKVTVKTVPADDERLKEKHDDFDDIKIEKPKTQTADECVEKISESGRLFVRNLPYVSTVEEIEALFKSYGPLTEVKLPMAPVFGSNGDGEKKSKGIALVTFVFPEHALKAYGELDGTIYKGRMLHIIAGEEKADEEKKPQQQPNDASFKKKKAAELKSTAGQPHNWNALFLSANAVADVLADRLDTEKSRLLDSRQHGAGLGVRMALGETHLVRETRDFLLQHGVRLDSFSRPDAVRSKTVVLVKNLPAKTSSDELKEKFSKFGELARLVLPPSGISGLVEFMNEQQAKKAFASLAYSRFKTVPLYLEWAPGDVFMGNAIDGEHEIPDEAESDGKQPQNSEEKRVKAASPQPEEEGTALFVKNLNFETTDDQLKEHFSKIGPLVYANVAKKRTSSKGASQGLLSMGFGFVLFQRMADAKKALKELQGRELDGFSLQLKTSDRRFASDGKKRRRSSSGDDGKEKTSETKILVKNIPFEASRKEVDSLFRTFGDLRFVRMPKKSSAEGHRGFGFVDFVSNSDAKKAFEALCHSTHLYGRRLVMEWATTADDTIEELQKKVATRVASKIGRRKFTKKHKLNLDEDNPKELD